MTIRKIDTAGSKFGSVARMQKRIAGARRMRLPHGTPQGEPVHARVNNGRWIADCPCGGAEYVDPRDRRMFCFSCANIDNGGWQRPVIFPRNYRQIENELLKREILPLEWVPSESVEDLEAQRMSAERKV